MEDEGDELEETISNSAKHQSWRSTVDGQNPARMMNKPIIYRVLAPSRVVVWDFFHQQYHRSV